MKISLIFGENSTKCMQNIAKYAQPYDYEYRDNLPKTAVGKIAYRDLEKK